MDVIFHSSFLSSIIGAAEGVRTHEGADYPWNRNATQPLVNLKNLNPRQVVQASLIYDQYKFGQRFFVKKGATISGLVGSW